MPASKISMASSSKYERVRQPGLRIQERQNFEGHSLVVHAALHFSGQQTVNELMPLHSAQAFEGIAYNIDRKMRLAAAIHAGQG